ncbi:hypothetical protein AGLY_010934 [Aphis glycines]|uniref:Uncharacterized protein n=1 Tax=Aphis glycines TaxID=307491 RepID=A0A6G0TCE9_APHGL|nr:hypothetical protein AGLY_010934 [Aphis glycines]
MVVLLPELVVRVVRSHVRHGHRPAPVALAHHVHFRVAGLTGRRFPEHHRPEQATQQVHSANGVALEHGERLQHQRPAVPEHAERHHRLVVVQPRHDRLLFAGIFRTVDAPVGGHQPRALAAEPIQHRPVQVFRVPRLEYVARVVGTEFPVGERVQYQPVVGHDIRVSVGLVIRI